MSIRYPPILDEKLGPLLLCPSTQSAFSGDGPTTWDKGSEKQGRG